MQYEVLAMTEYELAETLQFRVQDEWYGKQEAINGNNMTNFNYIENEIFHLASENKSLPRADFVNITEFLDHAEHGLALDILCSQLTNTKLKSHYLCTREL